MKELKKISKHRVKKIFFLFIVIAITAVTLVVETYAWFIGLSTVSTSNFDIQVSSAGGLEVSLDGEHWKSGNDKLTISQTTITSTSGSGDHAYSGNTNKWPTSGLVPLSSPGIIDDTVGRLKFFEKTSLSATPGGYRIVANRVDNYTVTNGNLVSEADGYVAFDLFIRNGTGTQYSNDNYTCTSANNCAAEYIYLMKNPTATVDGSTNYGAANSLRVGFYLLAGTKARGASVSTITGLGCDSTTSSTTNIKKICSSTRDNRKYYYNMWEPNKKVHTSSIVTYFNSACKKRETDGSYTTNACNILNTTSNWDSFVIRDTIVASDNVDIYDGNNNYGGSLYSPTNNPTGKLDSVGTYMSPETSTVYSVSNQLFTLAGNSITKVRVYIWLEGQDIDNYDVISKNSNVRISFGLTKDIYGVGS